MRALATLLLLGLLAVVPAYAQRGPGMGMGQESMADVLMRRARVLDDSLGLDDAQETRLRALFADRLDTLTARAEGRQPRADAPRRRPGTGAFEGRARAPRGDRRALRPGDLDVLREPLFATLDADVRALLTSEQAQHYDAFRDRERARAEALRAARAPREPGSR